MKSKITGQCLSPDYSGTVYFWKVSCGFRRIFLAFLLCDKNLLYVIQRVCSEGGTESSNLCFLFIFRNRVRSAHAYQNWCTFFFSKTADKPRAMWFVAMVKIGHVPMACEVNGGKCNFCLESGDKKPTALPKAKPKMKKKELYFVNTCYIYRVRLLRTSS